MDECPRLRPGAKKTHSPRQGHLAQGVVVVLDDGVREVGGGGVEQMDAQRF